MFGNIFDFDEGNSIFQTSDNTAMDMDGHLMIKMYDNIVLDVDKE